MSSTPIKNGIIAYLPEYFNKYIRADIYKVGGVYVFVGSVFFATADHSFERPVDVAITLEGNTIERDSNGYLLLVVPPENCAFYNTEIMDHA